MTGTLSRRIAFFCPGPVRPLSRAPERGLRGLGKLGAQGPVQHDEGRRSLGPQAPHQGPASGNDQDEGSSDSHEGAIHKSNIGATDEGLSLSLYALHG